MKKFFVFFVCIHVWMGQSASVNAEHITFDEFISSPAAQSESTPYYDDPISDEYVNRGVRFLSGVNTPALEGVDVLWGGDIFNATNWPNSYFPVLAPQTQYLGLTKDPGTSPLIGIVIEFDHLCRSLFFETRKSGNNSLTFANINVIFFNTESGDENIFTGSATAYVDPSKHEIVDDDAWLPYSWSPKNGLPPFNRVLLVSDKKFAVENLIFFDQWDTDEDNDVDGEDILSLTAGQANLSKDSVTEFADRFGITSF